MGFFDAMKINLFSEMKGVVTINEKPVAGAIIKRTAIPNNDKEYTDSSTTDSEGRFHFNRMETSLFLKLLPTSIVVAQKVVINHGGQTYLAWEAGNTGGNDKGELNEYDVIGSGKEIDIDLKCELTNKETNKAGAYTLVISGICNWDGQKVLE